jgi:hypothetical protein
LPDCRALGTFVVPFFARCAMRWSACGGDLNEVGGGVLFTRTCGFRLSTSLAAPYSFVRGPVLVGESSTFFFGDWAPRIEVVIWSVVSEISTSSALLPQEWASTGCFRTAPLTEGAILALPTDSHEGRRWRWRRRV